MARDLTFNTFDGVPLGSNTDFEPHEIPPGFARTIIDAWVDSPGLVRQRGYLAPLFLSDSTMPADSTPNAMFQTTNPVGEKITGIMYSVGSATKVRFFNGVGAQGDIVDFPFFVSTRDVLLSTSPAQGGGIFVGFNQGTYSYSTNQQVLFLWRGGANAVTFINDVAFTRGSITVTTAAGNFTGITPGMFLMGTTATIAGGLTESNFTPVIGVVKNLNSSTSLALESPALFSSSAPGVDKIGMFTPFKGITSRSSTGLITTTTGSATVVGTDTKFVSQHFTPGDNEHISYHLYRKRDMAFIGKVNGVTNEYTLALTANAAVDTSDDEYVAINQNTYHTLGTGALDAESHGVGAITANYADRQWFANFNKQPHDGNMYVNRLWFSAQDDAEAIDISQDDGDFINVDSKNNSPIVGLFPLRSSLLIFTHEEVFSLTGTNPNQFRVSRLSDDGALGGMAIADYHGGVVWAGKRGVYIYDGVKYQNLLAQRESKMWMQEYDRPISVPDMRLFRTKDKILVQSKGKSFDLKIVKGKDTEYHRVATVIDIPSGSICFFTNCSFLGKAEWWDGTDIGLVKSVETGKVNVVNLTGLFSQTVSGASTGLDTVTTVILSSPDLLVPIETPLGPKFFLETARFSAKQLLQLKTWKNLIVQYFTTGALKCDLVTGIIPLWPASKTLDLPSTGYSWDTLGETFETWDEVAVFNETWDSLAAGKPLIRRFKFLLRSQLVGLRFYTAEPRENSVQIASWALGFKWMRPGRV